MIRPKSGRVGPMSIDALILGFFSVNTKFNPQYLSSFYKR